MNIIEAIRDPNLFRPFLAEDHESLDSWENWFTALRCLYGLRLRPDELPLIGECTGNDIRKSNGFSTALWVVGRRSGKTRLAALVGSYEATLAGREKALRKGEKGIVAVVAPSRRQASICRDYIRGIFEPPMLAQLIKKETTEGLELTNNIRIEVLTGDWRAVRGFTLICAIVDEAAFFGLSEESKVRSDTELIRALKPGLATSGGKLLAITSPYARKGWTWETHHRNFGNKAAKTLVWNCPSKTMNPTLPQSVIDEAIAEDLASAKSEYLGEFRDDVSEFLPRSVIDALVVKGRRQLMRHANRQYKAFCDLSGGRSDDATLAIGHREDETAVIDFQRRWKAPFDPNAVIGDMLADLRDYKINSIMGDNYAAEFASQGFQRFGINYVKCPKAKSDLYLELLPRLCSQTVELLDDEFAIKQLAGLERRTRSGGKDLIDHPTGGKDDLANSIAGVVYTLTGRHKTAGAF